MKKIRILIFAIFASLIFFCGVYVKALDCTIGKYTAIYTKNGVLKDIKKNGKILSYSRIRSDFSPKKQKDCPTIDNARVLKMDEGGTVYYVQKLFDCEVGEFTLKYSSSGELVSVFDELDNKWDNKLKSDFEPKKKNQCPTNENAEIKFTSGNTILNVIKKKTSSSGSTSSSSKNNNKTSSSSSSSSNSTSSSSKNNNKTSSSSNSSTNSTSSSSKNNNKTGSSSSSSSNSLTVDGVSDNCLSYKTDRTNCLNTSDKISCIWVENEEASGNQSGYCNVDNLLYVGCGGASDIPNEVPSWISLLVNLLKIATPIILIFVSLITLIRALASSKEDEIKKAQSSLIKKIIAAAMVFFVISIVQFVISKVAEDDEYQGFTDCMNCFLNNKCATSTYYKTVMLDQEYCTILSSGKTYLCDDISSENRQEIIIEQVSPISGYYLVGTLNGKDYWTPNGITNEKKLKGAGSSYYIDWKFKKGDEIKIAHYDGEKFDKWYKNGGTGFVVDKDIKGTLYFNPNGNSDWEYYYFVIK